MPHPDADAVADVSKEVKQLDVSKEVKQLNASCGRYCFLAPERVCCSNQVLEFE